MKLTYIYHSCYLIEDDDFVIIIDFYRDTESRDKGVIYETLYNSNKKIYVLSSHAHPDHFNPEILKWKNINPNIIYIFSRNISDVMLQNNVEINYLDKFDIYRDDIISIKAFGSTDIGISFFINANNKKIFHAGDLNNWHWKEESTPEESQDAETDYLNELESLVNETIFLDLAMFPVDPRLGKEYMLGAMQFLDRIQTELFAPMHFGNNYKAIAAFKTYAESKGSRYALWTKKGESCDF